MIPSFISPENATLAPNARLAKSLFSLNDDVQLLTNGWIEDVVSLLSEEDVASVGGML